ncbi:MAG: tRNA (adenosine(37)-N6)-methyltransferase TrmM, partial [Bacteroidales bacterium]|nr:tRNA (adenosine(37)-N6)-methyltransferase TrmM [Bacteroidales bacterium]
MNIPERVFRFKQFSISHNEAAMKVGTDAVLLGAWVKIPNETY